MGVPFYRSARKINSIAFIVGLIAVIIFIASCLLNVYAYVSTPTSTPTPSQTPTNTNTPRPTRTPTITTSPTITATLPSPTPTATSIVPLSFGQYPELEAAFAERGYDCLATLPVPARVEITCTRSTEDFTYNFYYLQTETQSDIEIIVSPYNVDQADEIAPELTWLTQTPKRFPWLFPLLPTPTPSLSPTAQIEEEPDEIEQWILESLPLLTEDLPLEAIFDGLDYRLSFENQQPILRISSMPVDNQQQ